MILSEKQIRGICLQIELQRGQAIINGVDAETAGDIGFHVSVSPTLGEAAMVWTVEVSGGKTFKVAPDGTVTY